MYYSAIQGSLPSHVILATPFSLGGESLARKGFGRVRIEPAANMSVDVFLTHTCASDENGWCREAQIKQVPYTATNTVLSTRNFFFSSFPSQVVKFAPFVTKTNIYSPPTMWDGSIPFSLKIN